MSGAGTSRKRRGPVPRPRGIIEENEEPFDPRRRRRIDYEEQEIVPTYRIQDVRRHPLLRFQLDWDLLERLGSRHRVMELLGPKLRSILSVRDPQYKELVLEFHCTFKFKDGNFDQWNAVSFSLGRQMHEMSIAQFGVISGFYTQEEVVAEEFSTSCRGVFKNRYERCMVNEDLAGFWRTISNTPWSGNLVNSDIRDPVLRYLHKVLTTTFVGRGSGENKVNWKDLCCLMYMVEKRPMNWASTLAMCFHRHRRGGPRSALDMGPYITVIAENLGYDPVQWAYTRGGPQEQPPPDPDAARSMQSAIPSRYQRPLHRSERVAPVHPLREPRPEVLTLDSLYNRMDTGFNFLQGYVSEQIGEVRQTMRESFARQNQGLTYMMEQTNIRVPEYYSQYQHQNVNTANYAQQQNMGNSSFHQQSNMGSSSYHQHQQYMPGSGDWDSAQPYQTFEEEDDEDDEEDDE
ncbi:hypothetical protein QVD17_24429 [Tagetes erecta]|uniref:Arabidopsis retrotransposon Orf1 C-terminal domain-containing protein n=1 Tax=Tagetes erecta TaxID=13708 RepID=A0AAD8KK68_TARER|nr:hypothetical protein QVD17_24429 [Tagetes erecta]